MIPATSVMLPISDPRHALHHDDCTFCREYYDSPVPHPALSRRAIQAARGLIRLPYLQEIREASHSSMKRISKLSGVSTSQISRLERGDDMAREDTALRLAGALYVTVADLEGTA